MFQSWGFNIAIGNTFDQAKSKADATKDSDNEEGLAKAMVMNTSSP
jgi:hydroxymethylpyrimidine pyrophosphatase-like HAD family hydrolase